MDGGHPRAADQGGLAPFELSQRRLQGGERGIGIATVGVAGGPELQDVGELLRAGHLEGAGLVDGDVHRGLRRIRRAPRGADRSGGEARHRSASLAVRPHHPTEGLRQRVEAVSARSGNLRQGAGG